MNFIKQEDGCLRHEVYVENNKPQDFDYTYIFKDGPGEYRCEIIVYDLSAYPPIKDKIYSFLVTSDRKAPVLNDPEFCMNEELITWIGERIGKKVGNSGHCEELVSEFVKEHSAEAAHIVLRSEDVCYLGPGQELPREIIDNFNAGYNYKLDYGIPAAKEDLMAGDIVRMDQAVWSEDITSGKIKTWNTGIYRTYGSYISGPGQRKIQNSPSESRRSKEPSRHGI